MKFLVKFFKFFNFNFRKANIVYVLKKALLFFCYIFAVRIFFNFYFLNSGFDGLAYIKFRFYNILMGRGDKSG